MKIQVLERCFIILQLLRERSYPLTELATEVGVQPTTLRNILRTLEELDVVGREGKRYTLGPRLGELGQPNSGASRSSRPSAASSRPKPATQVNPEAGFAEPAEPSPPLPEADTVAAPRSWSGFRSEIEVD